MSVNLGVYRHDMGEPYIHLTWDGYKRILDDHGPSVSDMEAELVRQYRDRLAEARARAWDAFGDNDKAAEVFQTIVNTYEAWHDPKNIDNFEKKMMEDYKDATRMLNGIDFKKQNVHTVEDLFKAADGTESAFKKMEKVVDLLEDVDMELIKYYMRIGEGNRLPSINVHDPYQLVVLTGAKQAATAFRNMKIGLHEMEAAVGSLYSMDIDMVTKANERASEIYRKMAGQINNLKGIGLEAVITALGTSAEKRLQKEFERIMGNKVKVAVTNPGDDYTYDSEIGRKVRNTSDVKIEIDPGNGKAKIAIGLSMKAQFKNEGKRKPTKYKSEANWEDYFRRAAILGTAAEYHLANMVAQKKTDGRGKSKAAYIRKIIAAAGALYSTGGIGEGDDFSYFMVYMDKVITLDELFQSWIDKPSLAPLATTVGTITPAERESEMRDRYKRSKKTLDLIRSGVKISIAK